MKRKTGIVSLLFCFLVSVAFSQKKASTQIPAVDCWQKAVAAAKVTMAAKEKNSTRQAQVICTANEEPKSIVVDIRNQQELVLSTYSVDSYESSENWAAWIDPRLIDSEGNIYPLDDLKGQFSSVTGEMLLNRSKRSNAPLKVKETEYKKTILQSPFGQIVIPLDKKMVRFEAEVAIEGLAKNGAACFVVSNQSGKKQLDAIMSTYGSQLQRILSFSGNTLLEAITAQDLLPEKRFALAMIAKLDQQDFLKKQVEATLQKGDLQEKSATLLRLASDAIEILMLQQQLAWLNPDAIGRAIDDMSKMSGFNASVAQQKYAQIKKLASDGFAGIYENKPEALQAANKALTLKREILLGNPLLDIDKVIVGRYKVGNRARTVMAPALGTPPNNWSNQVSASTSGFDAEIAELSDLRGQLKSRTIFKPQDKTSVPDLRLNWDANRLLFSMPQKHDDHAHWQLYEVGVDGSGFHQVTDGLKEDLDFFDPCYLPNGKIIVSANVGVHGVPCVSGSDQVGNLCLFDPETKDMRRLTFDQDANWNPIVMNNGRVMYVRWEYTDLTHYFSRIVMHMNPDGTEQRSLYGSGSVFPTSIMDVMPLPNHSTRFVGIISGHHGIARSGRLIIFDPAKSRKEEKGMIQELPFSQRPIIPIVKDQMVDGVWPQFLKPQPLNNDYFLVTAKLSPDALWGIYLIDIYDNVTLLAEFEGEGLIYGIPLKSTHKPPVIPEKVNPSSKEATVFIQDLYEGEGLKGVKRGAVKELRVFAYEYAYLKTTSDHTAQGIQSGWDIKRLLGTVPVEADGSVMFKVPANTPISLQPLDKDGAAIQWMRSWLTGQCGEVVSCVGCHEDQNQIAMPKRSIASTKGAQTLTKPEGGVRSFTFDLEVQPILDKYCLSCHDGSKGNLNFTGGLKDKKGYGTSYLNLHPFVHRQGPEAGMKVLYPYEYHASNSVLIRMLKNGHYGVKLTDSEWRTLYNWIDFNAPDKGRFEAVAWQGHDQKKRRIELNKKYANGISADWEKELSDYEAYLKQQPHTPVPVNFKPKKYKEVNAKGFPFDAKSYIASVLGDQQRKVVEVVPGVSVTFVRIPAGKFVMGMNAKNSDYSPAHVVNVKKAFWMSEKEISNQQLESLVPSHDSRFVDQQWKDHVTEGYPANKPEQSASRVSYHEADEFCRKFSEKSGLKIVLPSEVQWEWACRGGTNSSFWYGDQNSDFADKENMADKQTLKLAVIGVNPQPMNPNNGWYPYYTWLPKISTVDDGQMIVAASGLYQANPFGLYDMHGNVAEWTSSDYFPYPYKEKNQGMGDRKVVRGGSWKEHPKYSTSFYRKAYLPDQSPYNVGFRIIIED